MPRSFTFRLAVTLAGIGIVAAALMAILVNVVFGYRFTTYLAEQRAARERRLVNALSESYRRMGGWNAEDLTPLVPLVQMDGGSIRLEDAGGRVVLEAAPTTAADVAVHREIMGSGPLGEERRLVVSSGGEVVGYAAVRLPVPGLLPHDRAFRASVNTMLVAGGVATGFGALVVGWVLARRATAPARALTRAARGLASGDRTRRVQFDSHDEFGEMARSFNLMADTIEEEDRLRRTFAAEVAHELRTPLAVLQGQIEALQDAVVEPSPRELGSLHEEVLRLTRLVSDLETLARADAAGFTLDLRTVDLGQVVSDAVDGLEAQFAAAGITLARAFAGAPSVADPARIEQVVSNLLSNALKFTPGGGRVLVEVARDGTWAVIRVSDDGEGIPADELPKVFDRFYSGRGARARGSGIGLTVVQELVAAHGGDVDVVSERGRGATFTVRLPLAAREAPVSSGA